MELHVDAPDWRDVDELVEGIQRMDHARPYLRTQMETNGDNRVRINPKYVSWMQLPTREVVTAATQVAREMLGLQRSEPMRAGGSGVLVGAYEVV